MPSLRAVSLLPLLLAGCSGVKEPLYPVHGKVLDARDKPATGALVIFHPVDRDEIRVPKPVGRVAEDGEFRLTTYTEEDGAPSGEYAVTILWPGEKKTPFGPPGPDQLKGTYADPKSPKFRFTVGPTVDNEVPTIKLPKTS